MMSKMSYFEARKQWKKVIYYNKSYPRKRYKILKIIIPIKTGWLREFCSKWKQNNNNIASVIVIISSKLLMLFRSCIRIRRV